MDQPADGRAEVTRWFRKVFLALLILATPMPTLAAPPLIIAHRGASHDAPENTLAAFRLAWEQGADGIEGDWRLTKDARLVCIHDENMKRTAGDPRRVSELTFDQIRELDVGAWRGEQFRGERAPLLAEVLATVPDGKLVFIELKDGPEIVPVLKQDLDALTFNREQIVVIAFDATTIVECKCLLPELRCHWLTSFDNRPGEPSPAAAEVNQIVKQAGPDGVGFQGSTEIITPAYLSAARVGEFHVWTIDNPTDAAYFERIGAFGITSNRPGWLRKQLALAQSSNSIRQSASPD